MSRSTPTMRDVSSVNSWPSVTGGVAVGRLLQQPQLVGERAPVLHGGMDGEEPRDARGQQAEAEQRLQRGEHAKPLVDRRHVAEAHRRQHRAREVQRLPEAAAGGPAGGVLEAREVRPDQQRPPDEQEERPHGDGGHETARAGERKQSVPDVGGAAQGAPDGAGDGAAEARMTLVVKEDVEDVAQRHPDQHEPHEREQKRGHEAHVR